MRNLLLVLRLVRQHVDRFDDRERYERRLAELNSTALSDFAFSVVVARAVFDESEKAITAATNAARAMADLCM